MVVPTKQFSNGDVWTLRAALLFYGFYCVSFTVQPLVQKVFLNKSISFSYVLRKQTRFFNLMNVGAGAALTFPFFDLIPDRQYYTIISFFAGLFILTETYISYRRLPFQLVSPKLRKYLKIVVLIQSALTIIRVLGDVAFFVYCFTSTYKLEVYIFIRILRMIGAVSFAVTEFSVSKVTTDLISKPQPNMCIEMKVQLKDTKAKLHALAQANLTGGFAAIADLANSWLELQMTQALVIAIASTTFIFYGSLFRIGLEEKIRENDPAPATGSNSNNSSRKDKGSSSVNKSISLTSSPGNSFGSEENVV